VPVFIVGAAAGIIVAALAVFVLRPLRNRAARGSIAVGPAPPTAGASDRGCAPIGRHGG
jgi:hypothetical protein